MSLLHGILGTRAAFSLKRKDSPAAQTKQTFYNPPQTVGSPGGSDTKASAHNVGDLGSVPGWGRSPGEGNTTHSSTLA